MPESTLALVAALLFAIGLSPLVPFTGPIGLNRLLYLHAEASDDQRATARDDILAHVETFTRTVLNR